MSYKKFVIIIMTIIVLFVGSSASFIYFIDPMWTFGHKNTYNDVQTVIDERQQKPNAMHFQPFDYDTLLLGSSRSTYINQHDFKGMKVYNFSASNLSVREYAPFLEYATKQNGKQFKRVIIGMDFFKTSKSESSFNGNLDKYIETLNEPLYRYKNLLSYDLLKYSYETYKMSKNNVPMEERTYNRDNVANAMRVDSKLTIEQTKEKIEKFRDEFYGSSYDYNPNIKQVLLNLKAAYPNTEFIIFMTPISTPLFKELVDQGLLPYYERWLTEVIDVFGGVYNFMYPNTVTNDINNYFDGHHFYPEIGTLIAHRIDGSNEGVPEDFGQYVSKENLKDHLKYVESKASNIHNSLH
ncbi:hypothetical protein [Peribacillus huizhouensis]|uniref:Uncharacterized protein n=1 Tax=Peribacillus huizhouensis TaxID=1501239 RepID=A0ABR6CP03_9BACI|nr:hypothetical protein [Peribacillus huizhouensis]MBA9026705.1 hypothetical protein [Peribacillus huizhouensis]